MLLIFTHDRWPFFLLQVFFLHNIFSRCNCCCCCKLLQPSAVAASANLVLLFQPLLGDPLLLVVIMIFSSFPTHNKEDLLPWCQWLGGGGGGSEGGQWALIRGGEVTGWRWVEGRRGRADRRRRRGYRRLKSEVNWSDSRRSRAELE